MTYTQEQRHRVAVMRESGATYAEIAKSTGVKKKSIGTICYAEGALAPDFRPVEFKTRVIFRGDTEVRRFTGSEDQTLMRFEAEGKPIRWIAREMGRAPSSIRNRLRTLAMREAAQELDVIQR